MNQQEAKCVLVMDENLPTGILANAAAILGITLGRKIPECVGEDVLMHRDVSTRALFPSPCLF